MAGIVGLWNHDRVPYPPIVRQPRVRADDHGYFRPKVKDVDLLFATLPSFYISQAEALEGRPSIR